MQFLNLHVTQEYDKVNSEIIIGVLNEHKSNCQYHLVSKFIKEKRECSFCSEMNRDISILITHIKGARKTLDVGLALSPFADITHYLPYKLAGFNLIFQRGENESEIIKNIFNEAFKTGYKGVVLLAHNVPDLPVEYLENALENLRNGSCMVLGPLENGTFYLIGMKKNTYPENIQKEIFKNLSFNPWGNSRESIKQICSRTTSCTILPPWYLLKTVSDLKKMHNASSIEMKWKARWTRLITGDIN